MREKVLSNDQVIAEVNRAFVPLWLNVKDQHLPADLPGLAQVPEGERKCLTGQQDFVGRGLNRAFFARSWIFSPNGDRLLNPELRFGHEESAGEFLQTLARAQERLTVRAGGGA